MAKNAPKNDAAGYCMTVHKAQGSEFSDVCVVALNIPTMASVLDRRWIHGCYKGKVVSVSFQPGLFRSWPHRLSEANQSQFQGLKEDDSLYK
jgi:hypothetical protein